MRERNGERERERRNIKCFSNHVLNLFMQPIFKSIISVGQTYRQRDRQSGRQTYRQNERHTDRDSQADRQR
jgi:hypothetical protein